MPAAFACFKNAIQIIKFGSNLFKGLPIPKAEPLGVFRRKRNTYPDKKIRRGAETSRWDVSAWGTLLRGAPNIIIIGFDTLGSVDECIRTYV